MTTNTNNKIEPKPIPKVSGIKFNDIPESELEIHLKLIKQWLVKYNSFEFDNQSAGKLSSLKLDDINIVLNHKTNFTRIKLFVDYLELYSLCPNFAISLRKQFTKYYKYVTFLTRKILLTSKKIKDDTSVFTDFIILNYPFIYDILSKENVVSLAQKKYNYIVSFGKCHVINVQQPIFLLWSKKVYQKCKCQIEKFHIKSYFNIYTKNIKKNTSFTSTQCPICHTEFYHDTKSDIFIECQEIEVIVDSDNGLISRRANVFAFGNLVNAVKCGDCISLCGFRVPERANVNEKNFNSGYYVALNFNMVFESVQLLDVDNFVIMNGKVTNGCKNEEKQINELMREIGFMRKICSGIYRLISENYVQWTKRKIDIREIKSDIGDEIYIPFLNLVLDLSLAQRDYSNHMKKIDFLQDSNANYLIEIDNSNSILTQNPTKNKNDLLSALTNSRNLVFKSKIFHGTNKQNPPNILNRPQNDFKKYFRLSKQINPSDSSTSEMLNKALNLFLIFDNTKNDPLYLTVFNYAKNLYQDIISIYPNFSQSKYDKMVIDEYFLISNNKIIFINDIDYLTKGEIDLINSIISNSLLNITFWFCCGSHKINEGTSSSNNKSSNQFASKQGNGATISQLKIKNMENIVSKCEIVLNFSKRILKSITNIDIITEENYQFYISSINTFHYCSSLDSILELYHQTQKIVSSFSSCKCEEEDSIESFQASKFIEDYFVAKREIIKSNFDDLIAMLRITIFISILRKQYEKRKIILPSAISNINFVDVFMGIIIYESICGIKYGRQASSFGNLSEKIMFYDYASEIKKIIQKKTKEEEKKSLNLIPRSKTMKKAVVMQEFNFFGKNEKSEKKCELCQEIEKVSGGKDIICDFIDKVNLFAYNKEINFFN